MPTRTIFNYKNGALVCTNQQTSKTAVETSTSTETSVLALSLISAATNVVYLITTVISLLAD